MKILLLVLLGAAVCAAWISSLFFAFGAGAKAAAKREMRRLGMTKAKVDLFRRAMKLINRLAQITDLEGAMAGDQLSPETTKLVTDLVADYKREISKV